MSNPNGTATAYTPAPTTKVGGTVAQVNKGGVKLGESWFNYGRTFKGTRLTPDDVGSEVELTLVQSQRDGKQYVRALAILAAVTASAVAGEEAPEGVVMTEPEPEAVKAKAPAEATAPAAKPMSEAQKNFALELAGGLGIQAGQLDLLCSIRFGTPFPKLGKGDGDTLIKFLMGSQATPRQGR